MPTRSLKIDALRGLAIVSVVVAHAAHRAALQADGGPGMAWMDGWIPREAANGVVLNVAYSFMVPMFAFLAGYLLCGREVSVASFLRRRSAQTLLPYAAWVAIGFAVYPLMPPAPMTLVYEAFESLWFLPALFLAQAAFVLVRAASRSPWAQVAAAVVVAAAPAASPMLQAPFHAGYLYPFVIAGYYFAPVAEEVRRRRTAALALSALAYAALLPLEWPVVLREGWVQRTGVTVGDALGSAAGKLFVAAGAPALRFAVAFAAISLLWNAFGLLEDARPRLLRDSLFVPLAAFGVRSLGIYAAHFMVLHALVWGLGLRQPALLAAVALGSTFALVAALERVPLAGRLLVGAAGRPRDEGPAPEGKAA